MRNLPNPLSALPARAVLCLLLLVLCGCQRRFYHAEGRISSQDGQLGTWSLPPDGCSLAPFDGLPLGESRSVAEFAWRHGRPVHWSQEGPPDRWEQGPETLDLSRGPTGITGSLRLVQTAGAVQLTQQNCNRFQLDTQPGPPAVAGGPSSMAGHLQLDCTARGSHLTGDVTFRGCVR